MHCLFFVGGVYCTNVVPCFCHTLIQGDQTVSMHLMIKIQSSGAQGRFDHPVVFMVHFTLLWF